MSKEVKQVIAESVCPFCDSEKVEGQSSEEMYWDKAILIRPVYCKDCDKDYEEIYDCDFRGVRYKELVTKTKKKTK